LKKFVALVLSMLTFTATADEIDKRQILSLTEHQRDHILTEMRAMLSGTQKILDALSREDMQAVASEARSLGMGMAHKAEGHLKSVLPKDLMQLGMSVHKSFDKIAEDAESLKDPKHTVRQLVDSMQKCNACHASYQIRVTARAEGQSPVQGEQHLHHQH
jgi:hypothetical protein